MQISKDRTSTIKSMLIGAVGGAAALAVVGFGWGGWVTGGSAQKMAMASADGATVAALAPICVDAFRKLPDAAAQLISLQKLSGFDQRGFIEKGGWATGLDSKAPNSLVAKSCADSLAKLKAADLG